MNSNKLSDFVRNHTSIPRQFLTPSIKVGDLKGLTVFNEIQVTSELMDALGKVTSESHHITIDSVILDKE